METLSKPKPITYNPTFETREFLDKVKEKEEIASMNNLLEIIFKAVKRKDYTKLETMTNGLFIN